MMKLINPLLSEKKQLSELVSLQVFSEVRKSGAERMLYSAIREKPSLATKILMAGFGKEHPFAMELASCGVMFKSMEGSAKGLIPLFRFAKFLKVNKPDVIHIHIEQAFILLVCISRIIMPRSRIVRTVHGNHRQKGFLYLRRRVMINLAIRVFRVQWIACSSYIADIETQASGCKIDFIENWATVEIPDMRKVREINKSIEKNFGSRPRLLLIGNCDRNKNHIEIISNTYFLENFCIIHIGSTSGAEWKEVDLLSDPRIISLDVDSSIGYELCDYVVVPSLKEAMSVVVLESLVRGKKVLVTREWGAWWSSNFESMPSEVIHNYWVLERQRNLLQLRYRFSPLRGIKEYGKIYTGD